METPFKKRAYHYLRNLSFSVLLCGNLFAGGGLTEKEIRAEFVSHVEQQVGIREETGNNDGPEVKRFLNYVNLSEGYAWCAAFVCCMHGDFGFDNPKSAWVPDLFKNKSHIIWENTHSEWRKGMNVFRPGSIYAIWFASKNRVAHTGIVTGWDEDYIYAIDGNTNVQGSREGDGVYRKKRPRKQVYAVADYIESEIKVDWRENGVFARIVN